MKGYNPKRMSSKKRLAIEGPLYADERWVEVPYMESDDEFRSMREFAVTPEAGRAGRDLLMAVGDHKPFRRFREALANHPEAAAAWKQRRLREAEARLWTFCKAWDLAPAHRRFDELEELFGADYEPEPESANET